jgi:hypothetical protein
MDLTALLTTLGLVSAFANRAAEGVKALLKTHTDIPPEILSEVALLVSFLAGVIGALALNVNLLALLPADSYLAGVPPIVGVILTGCVASLGSEGIQWVYGLLGAKQGEIQSRADSPATSGTMSMTASVEAAPQIVTSKDGMMKP